MSGFGEEANVGREEGCRLDVVAADGGNWKLPEGLSTEVVPRKFVPVGISDLIDDCDGSAVLGVGLPKGRAHHVVE